MSSSKFISLWLRNTQCRGSTLSKYGSLTMRAALSTTSTICTAGGPAYVQKPDKSHPTPMETVQPAIASQVALSRHSKLAEKLKVRKSDTQRRVMQEDNLEAQLAEFEKVQAMASIARFDYYLLPLDLLDLYIPRWTSPKKDASVLDHVRSAVGYPLNWVKNTWSLFSMAGQDSFPGVHVKSRWSFQIFKTGSTSWLAPFRDIALKTYQDVNAAVAAGDSHTIKKITGGKYQEHLLKLARAHDPSRVYVWNFVKEEKPCKVVSIRAPQVYMGNDSMTGSNLAVQALVRFETLQTLQIYNKKGTFVGGDKEPRRVVQYLVFQKRMWQDAPWIIRDELFETLPVTFSRA